MVSLDELVGRHLDFVDAVLVRHHVRLVQHVLLLQVLHAGQVLAVVLGQQLAFDLAQPQLDIFDGAVELLLLRRPLQLVALSLLDAALVRVQLLLKVLVLLNLTVQVRGVQVAVVRGELELLADPAL